MTEFNIGDRVRVRPDSTCDQCEKKVWKIVGKENGGMGGIEYQISAPCGLCARKDYFILVKKKIKKITNWKKEIKNGRTKGKE